MKALKSCWSFFIFSNLFIAGCAAIMTIQTGILFIPQGADLHFAAFVFFSTLCSYSFHWYFTSHSSIETPRLHWLSRYRHLHLLFFFTGLAGSLYFFIPYILDWIWIAIAILATFLYSAPKLPNPHLRMLRKLALGKTIFLAAVWTYVTTVLPFILVGHPWSAEHSLFSISRYFLVYMICILFDYRDRNDDKAAGIRSLITYLEPASIRNLFLFSFAIFTGSTLLLANYSTSFADIMLLLIPGFIVAALYRKATRNFDDMLYYFVLDGLMAISSLLTLFTRI